MTRGCVLLLWACMLQAQWTKHVVAVDFRSNTAVAADFTGDGQVDIIANESLKKQDVLFAAPGFKPLVIGKGHAPIHSAVLDMDGDGDLDFVGADYSPGILYWLERPAHPLTEPWPMHILSNELNGIHGLAVGDLNHDGKPDLVANSALPEGAHKESMVWFEGPKWTMHVIADMDAGGLSHYPGIGDANKDGRMDVAMGAKAGNWFAWWEQPKDFNRPWIKHLISDKEEGATAMIPLDVNRDGKPDLLAARGHGKGLVWYEGPNWKAHVIDAMHEFPHSMGVADLDGDRDVDVVACSAVYDKSPMRRLAWYENDGKGNFKPHIIAEDQASYDLRLVDMNGDGKLDIVVAGQESRNIVWYENQLKR